MSLHSRSNWNLEELVFKERGKLEYLEENLSEERREPTTNSTQIWRWHQDSNPGHTDGDECSHHCATFPPRVFSWVWMLTILTLVIIYIHCYSVSYDFYALFPYLVVFWWLWMLTSILFHQSSFIFGNLDATTVNVVLFSPWKLQINKLILFYQ